MVDYIDDNPTRDIPPRSYAHGSFADYVRGDFAGDVAIGLAFCSIAVVVAASHYNSHRDAPRAAGIYTLFAGVMLLVGFVVSVGLDLNPYRTTRAIIAFNVIVAVIAGVSFVFRSLTPKK